MYMLALLGLCGALLMMLKGDYEASKECYARAVEIEEKTLGPKHPSLATTLNNWAVMMECQVRVTVESV